MEKLLKTDAPETFDLENPSYDIGLYKNKKTDAFLIAHVLLPLPFWEALDYLIPDDLSDLSPGDHVLIPLGSRQVRGVVRRMSTKAITDRPLKFVISRLEDPPLSLEHLNFLDWVAKYAFQPVGEVLAMALRALNASLPKSPRFVVATGQLLSGKLTPKKKHILEAAVKAISVPELIKLTKASSPLIRGMITDGLLRLTPPIFVEAMPHNSDSDVLSAPTLNPSQAAALETLIITRRQKGFQPVLLDGVTGSGKTEVYLEFAAHILEQDPQAQVLILLPEIALTQAILQRVEARFSQKPSEWHSGVSNHKKRQTWEAVARGYCRIVVGARSALFLPFQKLGLIIVDEEHDGSYKQEEGVIYQARDMAVVRAKFAQAFIILSSATPSLETLWNAKTGRYLWLRLEERFGVANLPEIAVIDLRETPLEKDSWLSAPLLSEMVRVLERGEQSLLFLNRRGYAPLVLCRACGEKLTAPDTDSWLVEHRKEGRLVCHLTGFSMKKPELCPHCQAKDSLVAVGPGVERLEEEVKARFPEARVAVFSSDTVSDAKKAKSLITNMTEGRIDILIATQAAAKGHNFPKLTLVGIVDADLGLKGGDLRAGERSFQLLAQAMGRAGRADRPGVAFIQTYAPDHPVMQSLIIQDRDAFIMAELNEREVCHLPPFSRLAAVILAAEDLKALDDFAKTFAALVPYTSGIDVFGPVDAPIARLRGRYRKRFLIRADRNRDISAFFQDWKGRANIPRLIKLSWDIDPYSFL